MLKVKNTQFCVENLKKKRQFFFDLPELGFEPQIFSNFPGHDLNFHQRSNLAEEIIKTLHKN